MYFNRNRKRFGHLFQGRFKAVLLDADEYLKIKNPSNDFIQAVSDEFGCGMESILQKGEEQFSPGCGDLSLQAIDGKTSIALGRRFDICEAGIEARHGRIAKKLKTDRKLKGWDDPIRRKILYI